MKNLYVIVRKGSHKTTVDLLTSSAEARGVCVKQIYTEEFDFSQDVVLTKHDAIYRVSTDPASILIEKFLINDQVISFYSSYVHCIGKVENVLGASLVHTKVDVPIIPTIFSLPKNEDQMIAYVKHLGGFPIILKACGGMHGVGVMKIDSIDSLSSICDFLHKKQETILLRKFIKHTEQARLIVLGNEMIACHTNIATKDFRTNVGQNELRKRIVKEYSKEIHNIAVKAVRSLGAEFGGVDILFDEETNVPYVAEVNSPCFFPTTQRLTNIDISGQMIDFLIKKSKSEAVYQP